MSLALVRERHFSKAAGIEVAVPVALSDVVAAVAGPIRVTLGPTPILTLARAVGEAEAAVHSSAATDIEAARAVPAGYDAEWTPGPMSIPILGRIPTLVSILLLELGVEFLKDDADSIAAAAAAAVAPEKGIHWSAASDTVEAVRDPATAGAAASVAILRRGSTCSYQQSSLSLSPPFSSPSLRWAAASPSVWLLPAEVLVDDDHALCQGPFYLVLSLAMLLGGGSFSGMGCTATYKRPG